MSALLAVLWKDLAIEWRSRDRFAAMTVFVFVLRRIRRPRRNGGATACAS